MIPVMVLGQILALYLLDDIDVVDVVDVVDVDNTCCQGRGSSDV